MSFDWKIAIPWALSLATVAIGVWQYADKQAQANREPFLKKQLDLVFEASETVSILANSSDLNEWKTARARFWVLYWGPLGIVENNLIAGCMAAAKKIVPAPQVETAPELPLIALQGTSLKLSHVARDFILESWDVQLPALPSSNDGSGCQ